MTTFDGMQGVRRVWPEMPTSVARTADECLAYGDTEGSMCEIRDWEMTLRMEATQRWLYAKEVEQAAAQVVKAWVDKGSHPRYHEQEKARLFRYWPALAVAINELEREQIKPQPTPGNE